MTPEELIERAKDGTVVGNGVEQVAALVKKLKTEQEWVSELERMCDIYRKERAYWSNEALENTLDHDELERLRVEKEIDGERMRQYARKIKNVRRALRDNNKATIGFLQEIIEEQKVRAEKAEQELERLREPKAEIEGLRKRIDELEMERDELNAEAIGLADKLREIDEGDDADFIG